MSCWLDNLTNEQRIKAYEEWKKEKADLGEPSDLSFGEWFDMEQDIARND